MEAAETTLEEVEIGQEEEEHPIIQITELEEAAVTTSAQEKDTSCLAEETVLEKTLSTSLQIPDAQEIKLIENRKKYTYSEQRTPIKRNVPVSLQDNQKPSTSKLQLIPSPFKRALLWPEPKESVQSKRRKEKLPAVVTSPQMIEYFKKKKMKKTETEKLKEERKKLRETRQKILEEKKLKQKSKKQKIEEFETSDSSSQDQMSVRESDDSISDEKSNGEEEVTEIVSLKDVREGDFILVEFKGGKRMVSNFVYLCIIQTIISSNEIEIMGLRSTDARKHTFIPKENDISLISFKQIVGKTSNPKVVLTGERVSYQFSHTLQVKEM